MVEARILLIVPNIAVGQLLDRGTLGPAGYDVTIANNRQAAEKSFRPTPPNLVILGDQFEHENGLDLADDFIKRFPQVPVILMPNHYSDALALEAFRRGLSDCLKSPVLPNDLLQSINRAIQRQRKLEKWAQLESKRNTRSLQQQVDGLKALQRIGRTVTALLDLDSVLTAVVDAAVQLTRAEEGSLLLLEESSGDLYIRASKNFQDEFVRTFRLRPTDTLAGQVLRTGKPLRIDKNVPEKIKTSYLVHAIIYVPLLFRDRVIGVLEVDNRTSGHSFNDGDLSLLSALADYAAISIENARLYSNTEIERKQLETILTRIEEGVIVVDLESRLILVNRMARAIFGIKEADVTGKRFWEVIHHEDLVEIMSSEEEQAGPRRFELTLRDGRVLNAQITPIPELGTAVTMQDITHLKELDRIKSDFVSTVSHDLRSPLTAILGYVELIDRVGPVNDQQREFIHRIQVSVNNITALINDLLDLGRIEAGFDARNEIIPLGAIIHYTAESLQPRLAEKSQSLKLSVPEDLPKVLGHPVRLRQMLSNLLGNAIKYTQENGDIRIQALSEGDLVILQVSDNGPGIPITDQPYIFDKFYRGSNILTDTPGTGLGLAIVKSIVENHQGRIWVESVPGKGSTFTVVLPVVDHEL
jgi:two-component system phosphate regulon sensor histidine kinase PhoR